MRKMDALTRKLIPEDSENKMYEFLKTEKREVKFKLPERYEKSDSEDSEQHFIHESRKDEDFGDNQIFKNYMNDK